MKRRHPAWGLLLLTPPVWVAMVLVALAPHGPVVTVAGVVAVIAAFLVGVELLFYGTARFRR